MTPTWLGTFDDLHRASSVEELWSVLLSWHGIRSSTQGEEPYALFRRFHADEPDGAVVTAALLCTDHRWRKASHHLIVRLVESGVLTEADEQQLAEWFVADVFGLQVETEVFDGPEIFVFDGPNDFDDQGHTPGTGDAAEMVTLNRSIWPPLRRWAAARLVAQDPNRWRNLLDAADAMPAREAAALAAGVMDAVALIPIEERRDAVAAGLSSGSGIVRLAALPVLAALEGPEAALACAAADPSAKVRAWTPTASPAEDQGGESIPPEAGGPPAAEGTRQNSLF